MERGKKCFNENLETWDIEKARKDFLENERFLQSLSCCDEENCDKLAYEYEKLINKCHDIFAPNMREDGYVNEKGRIFVPSRCSNLEEEREKILRKYKRGGKKTRKSRKYKNKKHKTQKRSRKPKK